MKRVIAITAAALVACTYLLSAQSSMTKPLPDVAKAEEERRKTIKKPSKVYTNTNLTPDTARPVAPPPSTAGAPPSANGTPGNASPGNASPGAPTGKQDQAYWSGRMSTARTALDRTRMFADALQSRINALSADFVNRDNPVEKRKIEADRIAALAELERVKKEIETQTKAITAIQDEARRAGVPSGWLRPSS
jgi:hypothetical protein